MNEIEMVQTTAAATEVKQKPHGGKLVDLMVEVRSLGLPGLSVYVKCHACIRS